MIRQNRFKLVAKKNETGYRVANVKMALPINILSRWGLPRNLEMVKPGVRATLTSNTNANQI